MIELSNIQKAVDRQLREFEILFNRSLRCDVELVDSMSEYVLSMQGKQMRPLFILLSAALHGEINEKSYNAAIFIELVHTASLVHDDVVDEAYMRRGKWSINALERSKGAVLLGDYILARGLKIAIKNRLYDTIDIVSSVIEEMSIGELKQSAHAVRLDTTKAEYFDIVRRKTALLMSCCGAAGAISVGALKDDVDRMTQFGEKLGVAFQIKDDILDYTSKTSGKITCNDIKEKKLTLPILSILEKCGLKERKQLLSLIRQANMSDESVEKIRDYVVEGGGIESSIIEINRLQREALSILDYYPDSEIKRALIMYVDFILNREK